MDWTVLKLLNWTTDYFKKRQIPSSRLDAELLLAEALKCSRVQLYTRHDQPLGAEELAEFRAKVTRRANREPVAYILGRKEFWSLDFAVGAGVLVPRPDTEILVDEAIKLLGKVRQRTGEKKSLPWNTEVVALAEKLKQEAAQQSAEENRVVRDDAVVNEPENTSPAPDHASASASAPAAASAPAKESPEAKLVLDLCTGSGIIPIVLARESGVKAIGIDISPEALVYAKKNAETHAPAGSVAILQGDLCGPVPKRFVGRFDMVTSNPPYIPDATLNGLEPEITQHEPRLALSGGGDGLDFYKRLAQDVPTMLKSGGWTLLEVGTEEQGKDVLKLLIAKGMVEGSLIKDLAGQVRVVKARKA